MYNITYRVIVSVIESGETQTVYLPPVIYQKFTYFFTCLSNYFYTSSLKPNILRVYVTNFLSKVDTVNQ